MVATPWMWVGWRYDSAFSYVLVWVDFWYTVCWRFLSCCFVLISLWILNCSVLSPQMSKHYWVLYVSVGIWVKANHPHTEVRFYFIRPPWSYPLRDMSWIDLQMLTWSRTRLMTNGTISTNNVENTLSEPVQRITDNSGWATGLFSSSSDTEEIRWK